MAIEDWKKDEKGVILHPLAGYTVAIFRGTIGVRLLLADRSGAAGTPVGTAQISCSPEEARALARSLIEGADRAGKSALSGLPTQ